MPTEQEQKAHPHPPKVYKLIVDQRPYDWPEQHITGAQIKKLADVNPNYGVWLKVNGPGEDKRIGDQEKVDLGHPGVEHFFTGDTHQTQGSRVFPS